MSGEVSLPMLCPDCQSRVVSACCPCGWGEDGGGISVSKGGHTLSLRSDSVGIATAGIPQFLPAPVFANSTNPSEGLGFLLIDQGWGTNYAQWFPFLDSDGNSFRWRYTIEST